jgi:hypothetical protein
MDFIGEPIPLGTPCRRLCFDITRIGEAVGLLNAGVGVRSMLRMESADNLLACCGANRSDA